MEKINAIRLSVILFYAMTMNACNKDDQTDPVDNTKQLVVNGNVEIGTTTPYSWWSSAGQTPASNYLVEWSDKESFSPQKSLKISSQVSDTVNFAFWAQTDIFNIPVGKQVTLKLKIKAKLVGPGVSIAIRGDHTRTPEGSAEQFATTQGSQSITGTFNWSDYSVSMGPVDASIISLTIYLIYLPKTTGEVYFDDISFTFP